MIVNVFYLVILVSQTVNHSVRNFSSFFWHKTIFCTRKKKVFESHFTFLKLEKSLYGKTLLLFFPSSMIDSDQKYVNFHKLKNTYCYNKWCKTVKSIF